MNPNPGMSGQFAVPRMVHSKSMPAEGAEAAGELPKLGSTVILSADDSKIIRGIIRHAGEVQFTSGVWVGVELSEAIGKNDGSVKGVQYFSCNPQHGIFVRPTMVFPPDQEAELLAKLNVLKNQQRLSDPAVIPPEPLESPLRVGRRLQNVVKRIGGDLTGAVRKSDPNLLASAGAISFMVSVTRTLGTPLGVDVVARERDVKVVGVREGPVTRWNDKNPEQQMQTGDIIVEVNGEQGSGDELRGMMKRSYALELQVFRESDKTPDQIRFRSRSSPGSSSSFSSSSLKRKNAKALARGKGKASRSSQVPAGVKRPRLAINSTGLKPRAASPRASSVSPQASTLRSRPRNALNVKSKKVHGSASPHSPEVPGRSGKARGEPSRSRSRSGGDKVKKKGDWSNEEENKAIDAVVEDIANFKQTTRHGVDWQKVMKDVPIFAQRHRSKDAVKQKVTRILQDNFFAGLPEDRFSDAEKALRRAVLGFLEARGAPVATSKLNQEPSIRTGQSELLPLTVALHIWIKRRLANDVRFEQDGQGQMTMCKASAR